MSIVEQAQACTCCRSYQPIITRQRKLPGEPSQTQLDLHLVTGVGARISLCLNCLLVNTIQTSGDSRGIVTKIRSIRDNLPRYGFGPGAKTSGRGPCYTYLILPHHSTYSCHLKTNYLITHYLHNQIFSHNISSLTHLQPQLRSFSFSSAPQIKRPSTNT